MYDLDTLGENTDGLDAQGVNYPSARGLDVSDTSPVVDEWRKLLLALPEFVLADAHIDDNREICS